MSGTVNIHNLVKMHSTEYENKCQYNKINYKISLIAMIYEKNIDFRFSSSFQLCVHTCYVHICLMSP